MKQFKEWMKRIVRYMSLFQWLEVLAIIGITVYFALTNTQDPWWYILIDAVTAITGVFCVVLCAGGKRSQYYWGFVNILGYVVISFIGKLYGEVMLNALYYLPLQFVGLYVWGKHQSGQDDQVEGQRLKPWMIIAGALVIAGAVMLYERVLHALGGEITMLDSMSTVISVVANALMVLRYREQWLLWIVVDVVTVVIWALAGDLIMTAMWAVYLVNACYGWYMWTRMSQKKA